MAKPTFVASGLGASSWSTTTSPKTNSVTTQVGDILVVFGSHADIGITVSTPTGGTSLSWTLQKSFTGSGAPTMFLWTATATTAETFTLSVARAATVDPWSYRFYQWRGSGGIGASVITSVHTTGAPSQALTTTGASSAVMCLIADTNESTVTSRTWRTINSVIPTSGNTLEKDAVLVSGAASWLSAYWDDAGTAGSKTLGLTTQTGADYSMASIEILGSSGSNFSQTPSDSVTATESSVRNVGLRKSDTATATDAAAKNVALAKSDTATASDNVTVTRGLVINVSDSVTPTESSVRNVGKAASDTASTADATVKNIGLSKSDSATASDSFSRTVAFIRALSDSVTATEAAAKNVGKAAADSVTASDNALASIIIQLIINDSVTATDSDRRNVGKGISDTAGSSDAVAKSFGKATADAVTVSDSASTAAAYVRNVTDSVGVSDASLRNIAKFVADSVTAGDVPTPGQILHIAFDDAVTATDEITISLRKPQVIPGNPAALTSDDVNAFLSTQEGSAALGGNDINGILS